MAAVPEVFSDCSNEDIQRWADSPDSEEIALSKIGLRPDQVDRIKKVTRFIHNWRIGKAAWRSKKNKELDESKDATIQKMIGERSLPEQEEIEDGFEVVVDCSERFRKGMR